MARALRRWAKRLAIAVLALVLLAALPVLWVETGCFNAPAGNTPPQTPLIDAAHRRNLADTWLSYPEWSIVHAYEDFAATARQGGEAEFAYLRNIGGYWSRLCQLSRMASARGPVTIDMKAMLYIIGLSFTGEMAVKGAYENTVGRATAWLRGSALTAEDRFMLDVNDAYARFLRQTPWYEFPFLATLGRLYDETPWRGDAPVRKLERRAAMTMEYGVKAGYATLIARAAALAPAQLTIRSAVEGLTDDDARADPRITIVERRADGLTIIETPRYRAFTEILLGLAARGRRVVEIAGNREIFVTALTPAGATQAASDDAVLFTALLQGRPGFVREGLTIGVDQLGSWIRASQARGVIVEHVYDY